MNEMNDFFQILRTEVDVVVRDVSPALLFCPFFGRFSRISIKMKNYFKTKLFYK